MNSKYLSPLSQIKRSFGHQLNSEHALMSFARRHKLVHFNSENASSGFAITIRGSTASVGQKDHHYFIGSHAGYDISLLDRTSIVSYGNYPTLSARWYVMQFDLLKAEGLPYIFIGSKQQTKAYYARIISTRREIRYIHLHNAARREALFHSNYAVLASPSITPLLYRLLSSDIIDAMAEHHYPFAVEIEDDTLTIITKATGRRDVLLDKLLHYGLWLAKHIDERQA